MEDESNLEQFLSECDLEIQQAFEDERRDAMLKEAVAPLRYEYSPEQYIEGVHPASHLHVGVSNEIRFAFRRVLNPMSFVLLLLRQAYPEIWSSTNRSCAIKEHLVHIRDGLPAVGSEFWKGLDECEVRFE